MPITKVPARDWTVEIETGPTPDFTEVGGLTTLTFGQESEDTDTTDFDSNGEAEHRVMQRGRTLGLEGFYLEDKDSGDRDPGQAAIEALGEKVGEDSISMFRLTSPGGTEKKFRGSVELGDVGGGNNDMTSFAATITRSGGYVTT